MSDPVRVVLADDHAVVRGGFRMILEAREDIEVVGEAGDGQAALDLVAGAEPPVDVVLMDLQMPGLDGVEATRRLIATGSRARVLVLTTFDDDEHVLAAVRAGASGFLLKDTRPEELVAAVRTVHRGEALLAPSVTRRLLDRLAGDTRPAPVPGALDVLTDREREVLTLIARGRSNAEIAQDLVVSPATVKTHITSILRKLSARDRVQAVVAAYDAGLVTPGAG